MRRRDFVLVGVLIEAFLFFRYLLSESEPVEEGRSASDTRRSGARRVAEV